MHLSAKKNPYILNMFQACTNINTCYCDDGWGGPDCGFKISTTSPMVTHGTSIPTSGSTPTVITSTLPWSTGTTVVTFGK